ncbi:MAG: TraB/GumN family protein [Aureispira sp.]
MSVFKILSAVFSVALCWAVAIAPAKAQKTATAPTADKLEKSLLWKITGKGIKPSYLFGTIHIIGAKDYLWTPTMDKALKKSKKLVTEIDMSKQLSMAMEMMQLAKMKDDKTLEDIMSEEDYNLVKTYFLEESKSSEAKMTFGFAQTWQPMMLMSVLYPEMIEGPVKMYEMELTKLAKAEEMEFGGLETVSDQMAIFHTIPYDQQAETLVESVKDLKSGDGKMLEDLSKMTTYYKAQDVDGLLESMGEEMDEMGNQEDMLDNRNEKWIPQIIATSKKTPTFYAVGAGHLGGPKGVIRLLRAAGYKVTPVN